MNDIEDRVDQTRGMLFSLYAASQLVDPGLQNLDS